MFGGNVPKFRAVGVTCRMGAATNDVEFDHADTRFGSGTGVPVVPMSGLQ